MQLSKILIIKIWSHKLPAFAALATMVIISLWPALPLRGIGNWLLIYTNNPYITYFYPIVSILSGLYVGLYVYNKKVSPCCSVETVKSGAAGSFMGIFLGACPACIPVIAIFFPLALNVFLSRVAPIFSVASIVILLWVIYRMNGFKRFV